MMTTNPRGNSRRKKLLGMAVAILLPLSFFITAKVLGKDKILMPYYYLPLPTEVRKVPSDSFRNVENDVLKTEGFTGINQLGEAVDLNGPELKDKVVVINFFFTSCPTICPKLTSNVRMLQNAYRRTPMKNNDELVQFISITVQPERDTFPALRAYAERYRVNHTHWWFVTGDKKTIYDFARRQLHLSVGEGDGGADDFIHPEQFVLLDKDRFVRGYYNGLDSNEVAHCANDIALLAMEKKRR